MFAEFNQTITGTRPATGSYVDGVWTAGADAALSIEASVNPSTAQELQLLPEGRRTDGAYTLCTETEVLEGDVFSIYGDDHEVIRRQVWQNGILPHYLAICVRMHP